MAEPICYYANRLSFRDLEGLLGRMRGHLPRQTIHRLTERVATDMSDEVASGIASTETSPLPTMSEMVDIYDPKAREVLVLEDGILVKAQKPERGEDKMRHRKWINTDVVLLERPDGSFRYVTQSVRPDGTDAFGVAQALRAAFIRCWGTSGRPLSVVAITDGAQPIRDHLAAALGLAVVVILDWYHITKKLQVHLSQICHGNAHRKQTQRAMEACLWRGDVQGALAILAALQPRNPEVAEQLLGCLTRHASEIIDHKRRKDAGKPIGSGRMEKGVDTTIGHRQKCKGMSWSADGSRALAHLKCAECNGDWGELWSRRAAA